LVGSFVGTFVGTFVGDFVGAIEGGFVGAVQSKKFKKRHYILVSNSKKVITYNSILQKNKR
jgi:outer membrane lipoprotein SlyB